MKYKAQKMKVLINARLTEDEYGLLCEALRSYAEINYEAGFNTTDIERLYECIIGLKLTGHK